VNLDERLVMPPRKGHYSIPEDSRLSGVIRSARLPHGNVEGLPLRSLSTEEPRRGAPRKPSV